MAGLPTQTRWSQPGSKLGFLAPAGRLALRAPAAVMYPPPAPAHRDFISVTLSPGRATMAAGA